MSDNDPIKSFIAEWALTGGSELANTHSFVNGHCALIGVDPPKDKGSKRTSLASAHALLTCAQLVHARGHNVAAPTRARAGFDAGGRA